MIQQNSISRRLFVGANAVFLAALSILCIFPLVHVLAVSFSSSSAATAGQVGLWPVQFTTESYSFVIAEPAFLRSIGVSLQRVLLGVTLNMLLGVLLAYPLAKEAREFRWRTFYVWIFVFTMLFSGGLIPSYIVVQQTGLTGSIWALVVPSAVNVFNVILMLNFIRGIPKELFEASYIDGAGHWTTLWRIVVPVSGPVIATVTLFAIVYHWNEWFNGLIYMDRPEKYPLQSYLQTIIVQKNFSEIASQDLSLLGQVSDRTVKAAQIFLGSLPILCVYPFLQGYFMTGIVMGSVKE
ncbi:MAG: transporter permease [Paenibacillus sp.]|nr:transporter permease [Paenibacillus sp.]